MSISDLNNDEYDKGWMGAWDSAEDRIAELEAELRRQKNIVAIMSRRIAEMEESDDA